jgi:hypothetical protein
VENRVGLSCSVQVAVVACQTATRIMVGVGDLVQRTKDGHTGPILGGRAIKRLVDAVCDLHRAQGDEEHEFFGSTSKSRSTVCQWFVIKTTGTISNGLTTKLRWWRVFRFGTQNRQLRFSDLGLKTNQAMLCQLWHKTDGRVMVWDTRRDLAVEASQARVFQSGLKTDGGVTTRGARGSITDCVEIKSKTDVSM